MGFIAGSGAPGPKFSPFGYVSPYEMLQQQSRARQQAMANLKKGLPVPPNSPQDFFVPGAVRGSLSAPIRVALDKRTKAKGKAAPRAAASADPSLSGAYDVGAYDTSNVSTAPYKYKPDKATSFYTDIMNKVLGQAQASLANMAGGSVANSSLANSIINPEEYATAGSNAAYDSSISTLQRALDLIKPQSEQNKQDISDWYGQLASANEASAKGLSKAIADNTAQLGDSAQGFINAIGGEASPASAGIAGAATLGEGALRAVGSADQNFMSNLGTVIGLQKTQALTNEGNRASQMGMDLRSQIADAKKEKGQAYTQLLGDAQQQAFDNRLNLSNTRFNQLSQLDQAKWQKLLGVSNMAQAGALIKGQVQAQDLANVGTTYDIGGKRQDLEMNPAKTEATIEQIRSSIAAAQAKTGTQSWDLGVPQQRAALQQALRGSGWVGPAGGLSMNPRAAWNSILLGLDAAGLSGDPQALAIAKSVLAQALNVSHSKGQYKGARISNGQLVFKNKK